MDPQTIAAVERLAIAEEMAAALRHDLRNRFAAVRNATFFVRRTVQRSPVWQEEPRLETFFDLIDQELTDADALLEQGEEGHERLAKGVESVRLGACASAAVALARPPDSVIVETEGGEVVMHADAAELVLAMRLVVENAAESMPDGGVIVISMRATAGEVTIEVVDRGEGLVAIGAEQAFLPLQSTKPGHAGLGLAMVRRIVRRHGGRCELAAAPSGGTAMCMSFPNPQEIPNDVVVAGG